MNLKDAVPFRKTNTNTQCHLYVESKIVKLTEAETESVAGGWGQGKVGTVLVTEGE
jgi:hypothetical protein